MQPGENRRREAILFDLDGVIALSEVQKSQAHIETVIELNGTPSQKLNELYADVIGLSYEEIRDRFLECGHVVATPELKRTYRELYRSIYRSKLQEVRLAPGAQQLLQILSGRQYRIGLVSSAHSEEVTTILGRNQIEEFFEAIVTADSVKAHKPAPDPYRRALELLNLEDTPTLAVVFEDTWAGIAAAKAAGLKVFAVRHPFNRKQDLANAEKTFDSLEDERVLPTIEKYLKNEPIESARD
jgi:HAD superfamily hydrolase (TIGR01509 family)